MKKFIGILSGLLLSVTILAQDQRETEHFKADYSIEAEGYAISSLDILEAVWTLTGDNGYYLPNRMKFLIKKSDRNVLYFNRKSLKEISWEYLSLADFLPPDQGGKNCIYGLCHEMGHLSMYNTNHNRNSWMSYDYREAWADYFANMTVDRLYDELGIEIWPEPHDYRKYAGMDYFLKRIKTNNPKLQSFNKAGLFWFELGSEIGFSNIQLFFNSIEGERVDNPGAKKKFAQVLEGYMEKQDFEAWFDQYAEVLIINKE